MLPVLVVVLPLALDTFAVTAALGVAVLPRRRRLGLGLLFALFEGGMPLAGLLLGASLGHLLGAAADYLAIAALAAVGAFLLLGDEAQEEARLARVQNSAGLALVGVGVSVSLDELAIGIALGLTGVAVAPAVLLIAVQAFAASQLGFALGRRVGERLREGAERAAGIALLLIAAAILLARIAGHGH